MNIEKRKQRNSQIELARIIALVLIVFHHMAAHGYPDEDFEFCPKCGHPLN